MPATESKTFYQRTRAKLFGASSGATEQALREHSAFSALPLPDTKNNRNRNQDGRLASSSHPPLFSSDDLPAALAELHDGPRVERQHRRQWCENDGHEYQSLTVSLSRDRRMQGPFTRNYDSGDCKDSDELRRNEEDDREGAARKTLRTMESGNSIDGDEDFWSDDEEELDLGDPLHERTKMLKGRMWQAMVERALQVTEDPGEKEGPVFPYWQKQPDDLVLFHQKQEKARKEVASCVETGKDFLDLSYVSPSCLVSSHDRSSV